MPKERQTRKGRRRPEPMGSEIPSFARWFWREMLPLFRRRRRLTSRSARHLRNATVEVLEAMRAFLDETIDWLRDEDTSADLKRIRVED